MRAMVLDKPQQPLKLRDVEKPRPAKGELLVRVVTCAVCRTDLHVVDGELRIQNCRSYQATKLLGMWKRLEKK